MNEVRKEDIEKLYNKLNKEAESAGYNLNPDIKFTKDIIKGLIINEKRFGYWACPCRLAAGKKSEDLDIICPCDYRDPDLNEYDTCYCSLYVSQDVLDGKKELKSIPDRRYLKKKKMKQIKRFALNLSMPVWTCKVCGYLCARDDPPDVCPICKAKKDRFMRFM
jgi:ferredoxin-thioredoxin reductase catalytic subunit